jgi:hypothetical protein
MSVIPEFEIWRQEDGKFVASLGKENLRRE